MSCFDSFILLIACENIHVYYQRKEIEPYCTMVILIDISLSVAMVTV